MRTELADKLSEIAVETFEKYCALFPTLEETSLSAKQNGKETSAWVDFYGPVTGTLGILVREKTLREIAKNMIGGEGEHSSTDDLDAIGEIANVICGNILPYVAGPHEKFNIGSPRPLDKTKINSNKLVARSEVVMENGKVEILLYCNS